MCFPVNNPSRACCGSFLCWIVSSAVQASSETEMCAALSDVVSEDETVISQPGCFSVHRLDRQRSQMGRESGPMLRGRKKTVGKKCLKRKKSLRD